MQVPVTYAIYALVSIGLAIWVGHTLHRNGRIFLIEAFHNNEAMADAVNHLLLVGFYLINLGFIALFLRYGEHPTDAIAGIEYIATKLGVVLVVLGAMHFFNIFNFARMRQKARHGLRRSHDE